MNSWVPIFTLTINTLIVCKGCVSFFHCAAQFFIFSLSNARHKYITGKTISRLRYFFELSWWIEQENNAAKMKTFKILILDNFILQTFQYLWLEVKFKLFYNLVVIDTQEIYNKTFMKWFEYFVFTFTLNASCILTKNYFECQKLWSVFLSESFWTHVYNWLIRKRPSWKSFTRQPNGLH